ncbi:hypothetical protein AB1Y20_005487 [Prymnesium parvum]|uniref:Transient receptor potential cation channel subfamily M member 2 n=1 Tax=Prymnesium parvum TaxID=97485 RepID=A0AB34J6D2_PRYPA
MPASASPCRLSPAHRRFSPVAEHSSRADRWPLDPPPHPPPPASPSSSTPAASPRPIAAQRSTSRRLHAPLHKLRRPGGGAAAFGALRFARASRPAAAKWVCVTEGSRAEEVLELLLQTWRLRRPEVLISVAGAASGPAPLEEKEQLVFRRGLLQAARRTRAWIVTGGTEGGVMAMVGRTVRDASEDQQLVCLGVTSWGAVLSHEKMEQRGNGKVFAYEGEAADGAARQGGEVCGRGEAARVPLDPYHTHFICVDDGSKGRFGVETQLRGELEDAICSVRPPRPTHTSTRRTHGTSPQAGGAFGGGHVEACQAEGGMGLGVQRISSNPAASALSTPMVLLVVGGGLATLRSVLATLQKARPVVVMPDSGGAAYDIYRYWTSGALPPALDDKSNEGYIALCDELLPLIRAAGTTRTGANQVSPLSFFHVGADAEGRDNELDVHLLNAILSDCETTTEAIVYAVRWGEPSIIQTQLESSKERDPVGMSRALELALLGASNDDSSSQARLSYAEVVRVLVDANVEPRLVRYDGLFKPCHDRFIVASNHAEACTGFELLRQRLRFCGYHAHLRVRERLRHPPLGAPSYTRSGSSHKERRLARVQAFDGAPAPTLQPNWLDLMIWAVLANQRAVARVLWEKTAEPLRAALICARVCSKLAARDTGDSEDLLQQAEEYERWAISVLDQASGASDAVDVLTLVACRRIGRGIEPLWAGSVMDEATKADFPCRHFVSHKHCQHLLDLYFAGGYKGSSGAISHDASLACVCLESVLRIVSLGCLPHYFCKLKTVHSIPASNDSDDDDSGDEWDEDYFEKAEDQETLTWTNKGFTRLLEWWLARFLAFWRVPKVHFCLHSASFLLYILLFTSYLCGPIVHGWPWMWQLGHPPASLQAPGGSFTWLEMLVWLMTFAQISAEVEQLALQGVKEYLSDGWNKLDILSLCCMSAAFVVRMILVIDGGYPSYNIGLAYGSIERLNSIFQNCSVAAIITLILRSLEALSYNKDIGELYTIFLSMLSESAAVYIILCCYTVAFGVAFTALLPQGITNAEVFERPFFITFWALLGDFDLGEIYELTGSSAIITPMLLFTYTFLTTIFLVNLLIAQMTNTYEKIKERSRVYRLFQRVSLIVDYKDNRGAPPPLNLIMLVFHMMRWLYSSGCKCCGCNAPKPLAKVPKGFGDQQNQTAASIVSQRERQWRNSAVRLDGERRKYLLDSRVAELNKGQTQREVDERAHFEVLTGRLDKQAERMEESLPQWLISREMKCVLFRHCLMSLRIAMAIGQSAL